MLREIVAVLLPIAIGVYIGIVLMTLGHYRYAHSFSKRRPSTGERLCGEILHARFPLHVFQHIRPDWLVNPTTGKRMELDWYNPELKLAVEFNGRQHYEYTPFYHGNDPQEGQVCFQEQQRRDREKESLCLRHGVYLIVVPYTIPIHQMAEYLLQRIEVALTVRVTNAR
jgi:hypothetical protein